MQSKNSRPPSVHVHILLLQRQNAVPNSSKRQGIMHYILFLFSISFFAVAKCSQVGALMRSSLLLHLQKQRSTKHTNSRQRAASHGGGRSSGTLGSSRAGSASRARINGSSSDANTIASRSLNTSAGTGGHGSGDDRRSGCRSLATRPSRPRRIRSAPGTFSPAAPGARRARAAAPPGCPGAFGPGA